MILLHAIVPRRAAESAETDLLSHDAGPVTVLYEETDGTPPNDRTAVLEHGRRVVALADRMPMLPVRYGTTLPDVDGLVDLAEERADAWGRRLTQLSGRCELIVHVEVVARSDPAQPGDSGRAYLRHRVEQVRRHDRAVAEARGLLASWSEDLRVLPDRHRFAVLVHREHADAARGALAVWGTGHDDVDVVVTGPWPPFSFCEEAGLS